MKNKYTNINFKVTSKYTKLEGFVTSITNTKIYVSFVNDSAYSIPLSLKQFKNSITMDQNDFNKVFEIYQEKRAERKEELKKLKQNKMQQSSSALVKEDDLCEYDKIIKNEDIKYSTDLSIGFSQYVAGNAMIALA